jgi:hypothetical protein
VDRKSTKRESLHALKWTKWTKERMVYEGVSKRRPFFFLHGVLAQIESRGVSVVLAILAGSSLGLISHVVWLRLLLARDKLSSSAADFRYAPECIISAIWWLCVRPRRILSSYE